VCWRMGPAVAKVAGRSWTERMWSENLNWRSRVISMSENMLGDDIGKIFDGRLEEMMGLWTARHSLALRG